MVLARGIMFLGAAAMVVGAKKSKSGAGWAYALAVVGGVIALAAAAWTVTDVRSSKRDPDTDSLYLRIAGRRMGVHLAEEFPGSKALVITDPACPPEANPLLAGLREGFGDRVTVFREYAPKAGGPVREGESDEQFATETGTGWFTADVFDGIAEECGPKVDIIVSTIGLPLDMADMEFWALDRRPKLALIGGLGVRHLRKAIGHGAVSAAVSYRPDGEYSGRRPPRNLDDAFGKRYLLVTSDNVEAMASKYSQIFE